jgi:TonB family protein
MSSEWVDGFARSMIQHAARSAPATLSERLEEEWLADFEERSGPLARLRFGVGCCWATRVIAHEYLEPRAAAAGSTTGSKVMTAYAQHDFSFLSRRTTAFVLIIGLHAVIIYGLATGLVPQVIKKVVPPMIAVITPVVPRPKDPPPPFTPPTLRSPPIIIDKPLVPPVVDDDPIAPRDVTTGLVDVPPRQVQTLPPKAVNRVLGGPGRAFPNTEDYYPPAEIRMGRTGIATVQVCTDQTGRLTAAPTLAQTSGSAGLDQGALKLAKAGSGHYRATMEDGRPVSSCYPFRIKFDMPR